MRYLIIILLFIGHLACAQSGLDHLKVLSADEMMGREFGTEGGVKAQKYILDNFKKLDLSPAFNGSYKQPFTISGKTGNNIGILITGKSDKLIVVTAHFDHLGMKGEKVYNGADDNASGTSALFEVAKYFKEQNNEHSIMIVALDAEEKGLVGAKNLVKNFPFELQKIALNINMDMIAHNFNNEMVACGTYFYPELKPILEKVESSLQIKYGHDSPEYTGSDNWTYASDHGEFHKKEIPFIYFGVADHKDYHSTTDTYENINPDFYDKAVKTIIHAIEAFDKSL